MAFVALMAQRHWENATNAACAKCQLNFTEMNTYRYTLEPYNGMTTRYHCPRCEQRKKTFSKYIDNETGEHLNPTVGRCNREVKCGYHYTPAQYFEESNISVESARPRAYRPKVSPTPQRPPSFIPVEKFRASLKAHDRNNFIQILIEKFGVEVSNELIGRYFIGTSKHWDGATVFWQIDQRGKVRTGKIMLYNPSNGKRVKEPYDHINWAHKALRESEFELQQCLFGEHLLIDKTKPVAIVESEKTAVVASVYLPQFIWLAAGSLTNLNAEKCTALKGRTVTLFPDINAFDKWSSKAKELSHIASFNVSDLLERKATEADRTKGFDLADYLLELDPNVFKETEPVEPMVTETLPSAIHKLNKPSNWEQITNLEDYFSSIDLPTNPVKLNRCSTITNVPHFIENHFTTVKAQNGNETFLPYLHRLEELKGVLPHLK